MTLRTMKELTDSYFTIVFFLRRIEYGVEPVNELRSYLLEDNLSLTVVEVILEDARKFDKRKVKSAIDSWAGNQNGRK